MSDDVRSVSLLRSWLLLLLLLLRLVGDPSPTIVAFVVFVTLLLSFYPTGIFADVFVINFVNSWFLLSITYFGSQERVSPMLLQQGKSSISVTRHRVLCQNSVVLVTMHSRKLHQVLTLTMLCTKITINILFFDRQNMFY